MDAAFLIGMVQRWIVSVEALAALGAACRLRREGIKADPRVRALLSDVLRAIDPQLLNGIDASHEDMACAFAQAALYQSLELLANPGRTPGWRHEDSVILQSQGQVSRLIVRAIGAMAAQRPELDAVLRQPGALLDVGTGVGWIAIEAARAWPALRVLGIDPWEPALALARENLARSDVADRVEFRSQHVEHLDVSEMFAVAWLPGPFITTETVDLALPRLYRSLTPEGWLIFGLFAPTSSPLDEALMRLRAARSGGYPWTPAEVEDRLRACGFQQIEAISVGLPTRFVLGRRIDSSETSHAGSAVR